MKNKKLLFIAGIFIAISVLILCNNPSSSEETGDVVIADNYESDDVKATAKSIKPDSASQKRTLKIGDVDWVYFSAIANTSYKIFTSGNTDTKIEVYSTTGTLPIIEGDDSPNDVNASVQFNCTSTNTYYIRIVPNNETVTGLYDLKVVTTIGPDTYEPDLLPSLCSPVTTTFTQNRTMEPGDFDWVSFYVSTEDSIHVRASGECPVTITLFDKDTVRNIISASSVDSNTQIKIRIPVGGTYFLRIAGSNNNSSGTYQLSLQTLSSGTLVINDPYENDNTMKTAKAISKNSTTQLRSLSVGDTDWVMMPVEAGSQYNFMLSSTSSTIYAVMYAKNGLQLQGPLSTLTFNCSADDSIYVKIYSTNSISINYELSVLVFLQPSINDKYEEDNTRASAKYFAKDSLFQDRTLTVVNYESDTDWVAFPVFAGKQYTFQVTGASVTPYIYLYSKISTSYLQYSSVGRITYTPTVTDTMYLMIRLTGSVATAYSLSVSGQFSNDTYEPDSSRATAKILSTTIQSRVMLPGDTDWVKYTVEPGDSFAILTTGTTDTKLALFSSSGITPILENDNISSVNTNASVSQKSASGGQFYIRVTGKTAQTSGAYTLQALSVKSGTLVASDTFENDNSKASATFVKDSTFSGQVHSLTMNDTDWISIPVFAGGVYTVSVSNASYYMVMSAYKSNDALIDSRTGYSNLSVIYSAQENDTIYFRVSSSSTVPSYTISMNRVAPPSPDSFENDNTMGQARVITTSVLNAEVHSLTPGDTDWVAIPVVAGGSYTVTVSNTTGSIVIYYYTSDSTLVNSRSGTNVSMVYPALTDDTIYYRMSSVSSIPRYTISMSQVAPPPPDSYENDNTKETAFKANGSFSQSSRTITAGDTDWVSVSFVAGAKYTMSTTSSYIRMTLFNKSNTQLLSSTSGSLLYTASTSDTFYYQMVAASPTVNPVARYNLSLSIVLPVSADSYENDNTMSSAKSILTDSTVQIRTITPNDTDFVSFRGNEGERVTIRVAHSTSNYTYLYLLDSTGTIVASRNTSISGSVLNYNLPKTGLFYCRICSQSAQNYAYNLSAVLRKIDTLDIGSSTQRYMNAGDTQWVAIELDSGKSYTIRTSVLNTRLWLFDSLKAASYLRFSSGTSANFTHTPSRTGIYIIRICASTTSNAGSFTLSVIENGDLGSAAGTWDIEYTWSGSTSSSVQFELDDYGTFTTPTNNGTWSLAGSTLTLTFSSGTVYTGTVSGQTVTGTMIGNTGSTGTFSGTKL